MLTVPEAAKRIGRNPETVRRWIRAGKLASSKVGTQHLIAETDLARVAGGPIGATRLDSHRVSEVPAPYTGGVAPQAVQGGVGDLSLPAIVGRIVHLVDPVRIILFGSRARGGARDDSDYDILVLMNQVEHRRETRISIRRSLADLEVPVDIVVATPSDVAGGRRGPRGIVQWAAEQGRVVYERA
jgi:excisionase family DNA binding protein